MKHLYSLTVAFILLLCSNTVLSQLVITTTSNSSTSCNGSMSFPSHGNYNPAVYSWNWYQGAYFPGATPMSTNDTLISNLCVGAYTFILDSMGISIVTENILISDLCGQMQSNSNIIYSMPNSCDGAIDYAATGATPPYTYSWSNGATTEDISNLCPGMYNVVCTDSYGCSLNSTFEVGTDYPPIFEAYIDYLHDYNSDCSGNATVYALNGTTPYSFLWSTGDTTDYIDSLCAGVYSVSVWDATNTDTLNLDFIIADSSTLYGNNPYPNVPVLDTLYSNLVTNCIIDYTDIDSANLYSAVYDSIYQNIYVTWAVYSPSDTTYINDTLGLAGLQGYYTLTISVYCPNKSTNDFFAIEGVVYFTGSGISMLTVAEENPFESVSIYPNPFSNSISIDNKDGSIRSMKLIDLNGRVLSEMNQVNPGLVEMNQLEEISSGTYLLILSGENSSKTYKVIK